MCVQRLHGLKANWYSGCARRRRGPRPVGLRPGWGPQGAAPPPAHPTLTEAGPTDGRPAVGVAVVWRTQAHPPPAPARVTKRQRQRRGQHLSLLARLPLFSARSGCSCQLSRASSYGDQTAASTSRAGSAGGLGGKGSRGGQEAGRGAGANKQGCGEGWLGREGGDQGRASSGWESENVGSGEGGQGREGGGGC